MRFYINREHASTWMLQLTPATQGPLLGELIFRRELIGNPGVYFMSLGNPIESRIEQHKRVMRALLSISSDSIQYMNNQIIEDSSQTISRSGFFRS